MNKKVLMIIPISILLVVALISQIPQYSTLVFADGTPDTYGNRISALYFMQYNGTVWEANTYAVCFETVATYLTTTDALYLPNVANTSNYQYHVYSAGTYALRINALEPVKFSLALRLNYTFAPDATDAQSYMSATINITSTGYSLNDTFTIGTPIQVGIAYWFAKPYDTYYLWNVTGQPYYQIYNVTVNYFAVY